MSLIFWGFLLFLNYFLVFVYISISLASGSWDWSSADLPGCWLVAKWRSPQPTEVCSPKQVTPPSSSLGAGYNPLRATVGATPPWDREPERRVGKACSSDRTALWQYKQEKISLVKSRTCEIMIDISYGFRSTIFQLWERQSSNEV